MDTMQNSTGATRSLASTDVVASLDERPDVTQAETKDSKRGGWIDGPVVLSLVRFCEAMIIAVVGLDIWALYISEGVYAGAAAYIAPCLLMAGIVPMVLQAFGLYTIHSLLRVAEHSARVFMAWTFVFGLMTALIFFSKLGDIYSRVWLAGWYSFGVIGLIGFRGYMGSLVRKWNKDGRLDRNAVIVGGGERAEALIEALDGADNTDISIAGIFDDRNDERSPRKVLGYQKLGRVTQLVEFVRQRRIDLLIVSLPISAENRLLEILKELWVLPVDIRLSAHTEKLRFRPRAYSYIGSVPFLDVFDKPLSGWDSILKMLEDRFVALIAIILATPLMIAVAIAIKLNSKGPVFFKQKRYGFNNELIEVYKFRSMHTDMSDQKATKLVTKDDPRVTSVGRFIRKTSLDELPQLFNVLKGELSLVGPRPHATQAKAANALYTEVVDGYFARHRVKPGITGWAQVNGWRGETDTAQKIEKRVEHDLYYIENWSLLFDFYILFKTPFALLNTENAY